MHLNRLKDFQVEGKDFLIANQRALLGDDMGLGKTVQTVAALAELGARKVLIACPSSVTSSWADTIKKWGRKKWTVHVVSKQVEKIPDVTVVIVSYNLIISKHIYDQLSIRCTNCAYFWGLSGTLQPNNPMDLHRILSSLFPKYLGKYTDYMSFAKYFASMYRTGFGWAFGKPKNIDQLAKMIEPIYLRRLKEDVLDDLPEKRIVFQWVNPDNLAIKRRKFWNEMINKVEVKQERLGLTMEEIIEERKLAAAIKLPLVKQYLADTDEKVVVFVWHKEIVEQLAAELGDTAVCYYGNQTKAKKELAKGQFIHDPKVRTLIANIESAGTGLDGLQLASYKCIFGELPWGFVHLLQAIDRLHRMGQNKAVQADVVCLDTPIDRYLVKTILKKQDNFSKLHIDQVAPLA
jgi:SNF2 family DNA or RNA helicase